MNVSICAHQPYSIRNVNNGNEDNNNEDKGNNNNENLHTMNKQ